MFLGKRFWPCVLFQGAESMFVVCIRLSAEIVLCVKYFPSPRVVVWVGNATDYVLSKFLSPGVQQIRDFKQTWNKKKGLRKEDLQLPVNYTHQECVASPISDIKLISTNRTKESVSLAVSSWWSSFTQQIVIFNRFGRKQWE